MKSPKVKGIGEVVTEYGAKVMKIFKKGLLQRSLFDFYGDVKANAIRVKESSSVPQTPVDNDGGVVYVKNSDGKLYYKSNEVSEVELSAHTGLSTEEVQDIAGPLVATGGTKTNIAVTYDDASGNMDFVVASDLNTTGSAATLTTARAINGVDFDGSAPITITAAGSTLSDTVPVSKGGTGATSFADKAVIITQDSGTDTLAAATMSTNGQLLIGGTDGPAVATLTQGSGITITNANGGITLAVDNDIDISGESGTVDNIGNLTGDVTSSNRATTIANDAVTYAKMQNVSATNVVLGRDSAGAGVVEEISAANLRTIINVEDGATADQTQADINGLAITTVGTIGTGVWQGTTIKTAYIGDDQITEDKLADTLLAEIDANTAKATNVSTNLTYTTGSDRITIVSSDGTNVVISEASGSIAGVMTVAHHDKLDGIEDSATADQTKSDIDALGIAATTAVSLTAGDKTIDGSLDIGSNTAGHDFTVYGATTNFSKMRWDASQDHLHFSDQAKIVFGTGGGPGGSDSSIQADGSNLVITNSAGNIQIGDTVEITGDLDVTGNVLPGITYVKILPSDFVPDDVGRPAMIDDTGSDRWLESHGTAKLFAYVDIPVGFKATHVDVYGSATSAVTVYEADVNSKTVTSKGTGNIGTQIDITDVNSDATNYILIELAQASGEEVYGGKLTIAKI